MSEFADKVVLITGAGRGLGAALARAFAARGARLAINDINPDHAGRVVDEIRAAGGQAKEYLVDISKKMPVQQMANAIEDDWGRVDIVVNAAAVRPQKPLLDLDEWDLHRAVEVNLVGPFLAAQVFGRLMRAHGQGGVIVNLSSSFDYAQQAGAGAVYFASKGGLEALTQAAARELAGFNVRIFALRLGLVTESGPFSAAPRPSNTLEQPIETTQELAATVFALCSPAAAHLSGRVFG